MAGTSPATTAPHPVIHPHQIQPIRRRDGTTSGAVARGQCRRKIVGAPAPVADPDQRADHRAHLAVQKRARRGHDVDGVAVPDRRRAGRASSSGDFAWHSVSRNVVKSCLPTSRCARRMHRLGIERSRQPPDVADLERQIGAAIADAIKIMPLLRGEPRLEIIGHDLRRRARRSDAAADEHSSRREIVRAQNAWQ